MRVVAERPRLLRVVDHMTVHNRTIRLQLVLGASLAALTLQACGKSAPTGTAAVTSPPPGAMPLDSSGLPPPPAPATLAPAPPAPIAYVKAPTQRYRYVDRAAALNGAFADSPPDYAVDYDGSQPWIWRARDGSRRVVEHTADGDRYYYYDPGADEPYLVRGPDYTYAYDQGRLAVVYDSRGRALDDAQAEARAEMAGEYLARARQLYYAADHERHEAAEAAEWQQRREAQFAQERQWEADQQNDADWRAWHDQNAYAPPVYAQERDSRVAYAATIGAVAAGAFIAGRATGHDAQRQGYGQPQAQVAPAAAPFAGRPGQPAPAPAVTRQPQAQPEQARQAQQAAQANAARQQQAQTEAARQAQAAQQQRAVASAHQGQVQAEAARQSQANAARQAQLAQAHAAQAQQAQARAQAEAAHASQAAAQARAARPAPAAAPRPEPPRPAPAPPKPVAAAPRPAPAAPPRPAPAAAPKPAAAKPAAAEDHRHPQP